jgi:uncharacterized protein
VASTNVETLSSAYEALNEGDVEAALAVLDSDAKWVEHSSLPEAGTYSGRDSIRAFLAGFLDSWDEFHQEVEHLEEAGDRVAVVLRSFARGRGSGVEVQARYAHVWTMRQGSGVRVDTYQDIDEGLQALRARAEA